MRRTARTMRRRRNMARAMGGSQGVSGGTPAWDASRAGPGSASNSADDGLSTRTLVMQRLVKLPLYALVLVGMKYFKAGETDPPSAAKAERTFVAGPGVTVHVVRDFLPRDLALRWQRAMIDEWDAMGFGSEEDERCSVPSNPSGSWRYATNNDGETAGHNLKTRGTHLVPERNATAWRMRDDGAFAYSKWELDHGHDLVKEIQSTFEAEETARRLGGTVGGEGGRASPGFRTDLSDFFVTNYAPGDFLTAHDDGFSGSWAFVVSLAQMPEDSGWDGGRLGGTLRFECPYERDEVRNGQRSPPGPVRWCETVEPSFNSAVFFRTRPQGPRHEVTPVSWEARTGAFGRFGITGWYMEVGDSMSEIDAAELAKGRARPKV